eukprot:2677305-Prymnesium_polylepis.1
MMGICVGRKGTRFHRLEPLQGVREVSDLGCGMRDGCGMDAGMGSGTLTYSKVENTIRSTLMHLPS